MSAKHTVYAAGAVLLLLAAGGVGFYSVLHPALTIRGTSTVAPIIALVWGLIGAAFVCWIGSISWSDQTQEMEHELAMQQREEVESR